MSHRETAKRRGAPAFDGEPGTAGDRGRVVVLPLGQMIDPLVRELLALEDAWHAYQRANAINGLLIDTSPGGSWELPHAGHVYRAWSELEDLYETGKTPIDEAHETLRMAARKWLDRPAQPTAGFIEQWVSEAEDAAGALFKRDGDWWHEPH